MANLSVKAREASWGIVHPEVDQDVVQKSTLTSADFTYLGMYRVPQTMFGIDSSSRMTGTGLALRRVGGDLRIFTQGHMDQYDNPVFEWTLPAQSPSLDNQTAPLLTGVNYWGATVYGAGSATYRKITRATTAPKANGVNGLWWDESRQRLWWSFSNSFDMNGDEPILGYAALTTPVGSGGTSQATAYGPWGIDTQNHKQGKGFVFELPPTIQALTGARVAVGTKSESIQGTQPQGPLCLALTTEPQDDSVAWDGGTWPTSGFFRVGTDKILCYPYPDNQTDHRMCHRAADYYCFNAPSPTYDEGPFVPTTNGTPPSGIPNASRNGDGASNPIGTWNASAWTQEGDMPDWGPGAIGLWNTKDVTTGAVWVETATRCGLVYVGTQVAGYTGYPPDAGVHTWWASHGLDAVAGATRVRAQLMYAAMFIYDLASLEASARHQIAEYEPVPTIYRLTTTDVPTLWNAERQQTPQPRTAENMRTTPNWGTLGLGGCAYDATTRRFYAVTSAGWINYESFPALHVWEVAN